MSKEIDFKQLSTLGKALATVTRRYVGFAFIIGVLCVYGFLVLRINTLSQREPSDEQVTEQMSTVKRLTIDQPSIDKIEELKDQNVAVESIFKEARENPFQDQ